MPLVLSSHVGLDLRVLATDAQTRDGLGFQPSMGACVDLLGDAPGWYRLRPSAHGFAAIYTHRLP